MKSLPVIEHTGQLAVLTEIPAFLIPDHESRPANGSRYSCSFCGVGDSASLVRESSVQAESGPGFAGEGILTIEQPGGPVEFPASLQADGRLTLHNIDSATPAAPLLSGTLTIGEMSRPVVARAVKDGSDSNQRVWQIATAAVSSQKTRLKEKLPTPGCMKLQSSMGQQRPAFPIHVQPTELESESGGRRALTYQQSIETLADLLLEHRPPHARTLIYACGQIDYFAIFAFQEVFRLLGIRNLAGNAEHCLNAGAVHNEMLTGQEGPFLTLEAVLQGPDRFFLFNGWNGLVSHPPAFGQLMKYPGFDSYLIETVVSESALAFVKKYGEERLLLVRSGSDPQLALAVAHEILTRFPDAVEQRFVDQYADGESFKKYCEIALADEYAADATAQRIAPEPELIDRLANGIRDIAAKIAAEPSVPINVPSVGLSQTKGAVAHCLWGSVLAMVGKYGLNADGSVAGGTLRIPGQVNAQTEVQGLSRGFFMGRIRMTEEGIREATSRMGLPDDAYQTALDDTARAALDYSDPSDKPELFLCFGTQFESNMLGRRRWIEKLLAPNTKLVVIDPIPDPFTVAHADLIVPSPPHAAAAKLYQNGEWRMTLSIPAVQAPPETRTDATIVYDVMAEISRRLREDAALRERHPDLARHSEYMRRRFESPDQGGELQRVAGEVSRPQLWQRIQDYQTGTDDCIGPLYCRPEHADGRPIEWSDFLDSGQIIYGGVGTTRYRLDYDDPDHIPFRDIFRRPGQFRFFVPTEQDVSLSDGVTLISGRSCLSDDRKRIRFAIATFNSGKATPVVDLPDENPVYVSLRLAEQLAIAEGDRVRLTGVDSGCSLVLKAVPTDRVKGDAVYVSFHKTRAEIEDGVYLNDLTSHVGRCPYTAQSNFKLTKVTLEPVR